jgi:hypothetical protein
VTRQHPAPNVQVSAVGTDHSVSRVRPKLHLRVDALVLHGFPPADRFTIGQTVQLELARLFANRGVPESLVDLGDIENLSGGTFELKANRQPATIGSQVAWAVYQTLQRTT